MLINPVLVTAPAIQPVTLDEAKAQLRLELDNAEQDGAVAGFIAAGTAFVESYTGRALITRTYRGFLDHWPVDPRLSTAVPYAPALGLPWPGNGFAAYQRRAVELPRPPLQSIDYIKTYDDADVATIMDPASYFVDPNSTVGRAVLRTNATWPIPGRAANGIELQWVAGFGDTADLVPDDFKHAILLMASHFNEHREAVVGVDNRDSSAPLPLGVLDALIGPHRVYSF